MNQQQTSPQQSNPVQSNNDRQGSPQDTQQQIPNPKYKTALCKAYLYKQCNRGDEACHFAHGADELRAVSENQEFFVTIDKNSNQQINYWPSNIPTNYKTSICKFYEQVGTCKYDQNCNFAHGEQERQFIPESVQNKFSKSKNTNYIHVNNSAGIRNQQQLQQEQLFMYEQFMQQQMIEQSLQSQHQLIQNLCLKIKNQSNEDYVKECLNDITKLNDSGKFKQALLQLQRLCQRKESTKQEQEILKEIEKYQQSS